VVTSPLDIIFLRRKKVAAGVLCWVKPILVFVFCGAGFVALGVKVWPSKFAVLGVFLLMSGFLSIIRLSDVKAVLEEAKLAVVRLLRRSGLEAAS
jgi:hypothetical protein